MTWSANSLIWKPYTPTVIYLSRKPELVASWVLKVKPPFEVVVWPPDTDLVGLGAYELIGWQFFMCDPEDIIAAAESGLTEFLDSRLRYPR